MNVKHYRPHILVAIALAVVILSGWHGALRNALTDLRFAWAQREATGDIVVVAIDAPSIEKIGVWPWPRSLHADLLHQLDKAGVSDIAFDVDFSAPSDPASDQAFVEALQSAAGSVILPTFKQPAGDPKNPAALHINRPQEKFAGRSWAAAVNIPIERDGRARHYPYGEKLDGTFLPSMGAVLVGQFNDKADPFLVDFGIRSASIPLISYIDVLRGDQAVLEKLKGKKVIIGGTALELGDRFSVSNGRILCGPVLQALAAESMLQGRALSWTSDLVGYAGVALVALMMMFAWRRMAAGPRTIMLLGMALAVEAAATWAQMQWPIVIDSSLIYMAIAVYLGAIALDEIDFLGLLGSIAENRFQRIAVSLGEGLVCTDEDHRITFWNPGAETIFGHSAAAMMGQPFDLICADAKPKPFSIKDVASADWVRSGGTVLEFEGRRKNGEAFAVEACFSSWQGAEGIQHGAILRDISVRKREAERIRYLAEYDTLTGLANRNTFHSRLAAMIDSPEKSADGIALLVLGLDGFQHINDLLGHACGDRVLQAVGKRLTKVAGESGSVARLSGDEFAIAIPCNELSYPVADFAERIIGAFDEPLVVPPREHRIKISTGVAIYPYGGRTADELLSNGHLAFCRAKGPRRGGHVMFDVAMREELESRLTLEAELALAVEREEFELFYQPQVHLLDASLSGAEALIRWRHPERGLVAPGDFMPVVNSSGLSDRIAEWVMQTACRQARAWELAGHNLRVGINLSPSQLHSGDLAKSVANVLEETGLSPSLMELEVTEDILLLDEMKVLDTFRRIQQLGVRIVFDDFGTGYASLSYLKKFPLDGLKIDKSFVFDLLSDSDDAVIVGSTVSLSRQLGLSVIAEGIENRASADLLLRMGCEEGQGYLFGKPMRVADFEAKYGLALRIVAAE